MNSDEYQTQKSKNDITSSRLPMGCYIALVSLVLFILSMIGWVLKVFNELASIT